MKKTILSLTLLISAPALWAFSPAELAQTLQKPQNVQGNFVQQRQLKSLSKPMTTSGSFTLVPQKGLLWKMQKPFETTLRVRSDGIMQWNGSQWVNPNASKLNGQSRQIKLFLDLLGGNTQGLEKQFDLKLNGNEKKWTLTPDSENRHYPSNLQPYRDQRRYAGTKNRIGRKARRQNYHAVQPSPNR